MIDWQMEFISIALLGVEDLTGSFSALYPKACSLRCFKNSERLKLAYSLEVFP